MTWMLVSKETESLNNDGLGYQSRNCARALEDPAIFGLGFGIHVASSNTRPIRFHRKKARGNGPEQPLAV